MRAGTEFKLRPYMGALSEVQQYGNESRPDKQRDRDEKKHEEDRGDADKCNVNDQARHRAYNPQIPVP